MSLGYASRLSHREDLGGRLGDPELFDNPSQIVQRVTELANLVRTLNSASADNTMGEPQHVAWLADSKCRHYHGLHRSWYIDLLWDT
jgi:hypothetical protein